MNRAFRSGFAAFVLAATLATAAQATPPPMPPPPMPPENRAILATPEPLLESTGDAKVDAYRERLLTDHTSREWRPYLVRLLAGVRADPKILEEFDRLAAIREPKDYVLHYVTAERIRRGRQLYRQLKPGFSKPGEMPLELRLALWGMLGDYGATRPQYDALQALLVLAAHGKGGAEYEFQLHHAAGQVLSGAVPRPRLKAYATGKLGQTHTPAARFPDWARDGNGDGRIDIWDSRADILATIGGNSWEGYAGIPVAVAVKVPRFDPANPREARMLQALNASPNVPPGILERWDGRAWTPDERGHGSTYVAPFVKGGPAYVLLRPAWPVNSRDPILPMYAGSDTNMGFALAASLLADAIARRPVPPLK